MKALSRTTPNPTVLGEFVLDRFTGDAGAVEYELVRRGIAYPLPELTTEFHPSVDALAEFGGLLNAAVAILYRFDVEMAQNGGKYPVGMSTEIISGIDTLLRTALKPFAQTE